MEVLDRGQSQQRQRHNPIWGVGVALGLVVAVCTFYAVGWWPFNTGTDMRRATPAEVTVLRAAGMLPPTAGGKVYVATGDVHIHTTERITIVLPPGTKWKSGPLNHVSLVRYHNWRADPAQFQRFYDPFCELTTAINLVAVSTGSTPLKDVCIGFLANQSDIGAVDAITRQSDDKEMRTYVPGFDPAVDLPATLVFGNKDDKPVNFPLFRWTDSAPRHTLVLVLPIRLASFSLDYDRLRLVNSPAVVVNQFCLSGQHPAFAEAFPPSFASEETLDSLHLSCTIG